MLFIIFFIISRLVIQPSFIAFIVAGPRPFTFVSNNSPNSSGDSSTICLTILLFFISSLPIIELSNMSHFFESTSRKGKAPSHLATGISVDALVIAFIMLLADASLKPDILTMSLDVISYRSGISRISPSLKNRSIVASPTPIIFIFSQYRMIEPSFLPSHIGLVHLTVLREVYSKGAPHFGQCVGS